MANYAHILLHPLNCGTEWHAMGRQFWFQHCSIALPFPCFLSFSATILHFSQWYFPDQCGLVLLLPAKHRPSSYLLLEDILHVSQSFPLSPPCHPHDTHFHRPLRFL